MRVLGGQQHRGHLTLLKRLLDFRAKSQAVFLWVSEITSLSFGFLALVLLLEAGFST